MKVRQQFFSDVIADFWKWVYHLPEHEKQEFLEADIRQKKFRQEAIDRGDMIIDPEDNTSYIWRDEQAAIKNKNSDATWVSYFSRWKQERGITGELHTFEEC